MNYLGFVKERVVNPVNDYVINPVNDYVINPVITKPINTLIISPVNEYVVEPINKLVRKKEHPFLAESSEHLLYTEFRQELKEDKTESDSVDSNRSFFIHLQDDNKTYFEHFKETMTHSTKSFKASVMFFVHAIWPDAYTKSGYSEISEISDLNVN